MSGIHFDQINIAEDWFEFGKNGDFPNHSDDDTSEVITRFVAYWIAFNAIYSVNFDKLNKRVKTEMNIAEWKQIQHCINLYYDDCFKGVIDFNAEYINIFKDAPVFEGRIEPVKGKNYKGYYGFRFDHYRTLTDDESTEQDKLHALVQTIYQVRCNVFHGNKSSSPDRNYFLVKNSAIVLEKLLTAYMNKKSKKENDH